MTEVAINRLQTRVRIPGDAMGEGTRLKRVIAASLARELESAIERRSISVDGYLCIAKLRAKVVLRLGESDAALAATVAQGIADAICGAIRGASGIYYTSRAHVLADLVSSAMRADLERSWAWSQLGLWQEREARSARSHANQAAQALIGEARHAVAVISYLARDGSTLQALLRWVDARLWHELAKAASRAHGLPTDPAQFLRLETPSRPALEIAARFVRQSYLARALSTATSEALPDQTFAAIAILVMLEVEPAAIRSGSDSVYAVLHSIAMLLQRPFGRGTIVTTTSESSSPASPAAEALDLRKDSESEASIPVDQQMLPGHFDPSAAESAPDTTPPGATNSRASAQDQLGREAAEQPLQEVRKAAVTNAGGLAYLLNAISRIELPAKVMRDHRLTMRGLRWTMHQLGVALLSLEPNDPAALAFAGLLPGAPPPTLGLDPPSDDESAAIDECGTMVIACLRRGLADRLEPADISDDALIDFVCRRRAKILGDPGWIEVHFSIEETSPEIRFAGLDLDPGWIPWLGVVVKFIYA
jgi:hypothetical protein